MNASYDTLAADRAAKKARYEDLKRQADAALWDYLNAGPALDAAFEAQAGLPALLDQYETQRAGLALLNR